VIRSRPARRSRLLGRNRGAESSGQSAEMDAAEAPRGGERVVSLRTILVKLVGVAALLGCLGLLYDGAASPAFRVQHVAVSGNRLLSAEEVLDAAAVQGMNVFWVRRSTIAERIRRLPAARAVEVRVGLPGRVDLLVHERAPYVSWQSGETTFLVDDEGLVLGTQTPEQPLIVVHDLDAMELAAGGRVDPGILATVGALTRGLPERVGISPSEYDYSRAFGVELQEPNGPRLRFGTAEELDLKLATLVALKAELGRSSVSPQLIDLRFPTRPYYR
jgi:cell division septal protein FtsQ